MTTNHYTPNQNPLTIVYAILIELAETKKAADSELPRATESAANTAPPQVAEQKGVYAK